MDLLSLKMDILSFNFVSSSLFFAFILCLVKVWKRSKAAKKLPPFPWKLPLIGNLHHLMGDLPSHRILRNLAQKYGTLMHLQLGEISALVVSSSRLAEEIMKTHDLAFASRPQFESYKIISYDCSDVALSPYGEYWRQMRKICIMELLSAKNVRSFDSIRHDESLQLIASIKDVVDRGVEPINVREMFSGYSSSIVFRVAFGKANEADRNAFVKILKESLSISVTLDIIDLFPSLKILHPLFSLKPKLVKMKKKLDEVFDNIVDRHVDKLARQRKGMGKLGQEDLVDVLLRVKESGDLQIPITRNNIKAVLMDIFVGATENPSSIVEWAMSEMIRNPNVMAKAQDEIRKAFVGKKKFQGADIQELKYLKLVIKETLRLHPIIPLLVPRECREQCEIDGYTIPIHTVVMVNAWAIGRDPEYWEDPESFKPERFENISADFTGTNFHYLPFGSGRRACPGISFGLAIAELPLALLLYHFDWKLPNGLNSIDDLDMTETVGITCMKKNNLQLVATLYDPSFDN